MTRPLSVDVLAAAISETLADYDPAVQGATLIELVLKWLMSNPLPLRGRLLDQHIAALRRAMEQPE